MLKALVDTARYSLVKDVEPTQNPTHFEYDFLRKIEELFLPVGTIHISNYFIDWYFDNGKKLHSIS